MTSIGKCPCEFQETVTISDLMLGTLPYSKYAVSALRDLGVRDAQETHYAKIRISAGVDNSAVVTTSILPYGEVAYIDTISLSCGSYLGLAPVIMAYISGALGDRVGHRVMQRHAGRLVEWLKSVSRVSDTDGRGKPGKMNGPN